jgi:hypothetical protein
LICFLCIRSIKERDLHIFIKSGNTCLLHVAKEKLGKLAYMNMVIKSVVHLYLADQFISMKIFSLMLLGASSTSSTSVAVAKSQSGRSHVAVPPSYNDHQYNISNLAFEALCA